MEYSKREYPHLNDTNFPNVDNVDVYKYRNDFNYKRWVPGTRVKICNVNFRSDYSNVVKFDNNAQRDNYFNKLNGEEKVLTIGSNLLPDNSVKLDIPFDVMINYNYLVVDIPIMTSEAEPIKYENKHDRNSKYYFFIEEIKSNAPNTTTCILNLDVWTTFINSVNIDYMMLERGHAPMFKIKADEYLNNPINNNIYLLDQDINFGNNSSIVANTKTKQFNNNNMFACIVTTADINGNWGTIAEGNWNTPHSQLYIMQGSPSYFVIGVEVNDLDNFMINADINLPNFLQTIQGIFFIQKSLISYNLIKNWLGVNIYGVNAVQQSELYIKLNKEDFKYDNKYKNIAKLYTFPYSFIEISDEVGNKSLIKIEETNNNININTTVSLFFPYIKIEAYLTGIGNNTINTLTFKNFSDHEFKYNGKWQETLKEWKIPIYNVHQSGSQYNSYNTFYERAQMANSYTTDEINSKKLADTNQSNTNTIATADYSNANIQITANYTVLNYAIGTADLDTYWSNELNIAMQNYAEALNNAQTAIGVQQNWDNNTLAIGTATASGALGGLAIGATSGSIVPLAGTAAGALIGAGVGAIGGAISAGVGGTIGTLITNNAKAQRVATINGISWDKTFSGNQNNTDKNDLQNAFKRNQLNTQGNADSSKASNAYNANVGVASATKNASYAIAERTRWNASEEVNNQIKQAGIGAPEIFGTIANGENDVTRPKTLFANIITQSPGIVATNGDTFLRYGYYCHQQWKIDNFNIGRKFTYWKAEEVFIQGNTGVIENANEIIKGIFENGVTIWKDNNDIGKVSIYENGM